MPFLADPLISTQHGIYIDTVREIAFNNRALLQNSVTFGPLVTVHESIFSINCIFADKNL